MHLDELKPLITWLHLNPQWGGLFAFLLSFAESIAIIGLIVPGSLIMTAIGILIGSGVLPPGTTLLWVIAGAIVGDLISYWFGYHYQRNIRAIWPFRLMPGWLDKGEVFFHKHGGKGIIVGRFIGPIRPILPVVAGMFNMKPARFIPIDVFSATLWAPVYTFPGMIIGAASLALPPEAATRLIIYLVLALFLIWLLFWFIKQIALWLYHGINALFKKLWIRIQQKTACRPLYQLIHAAHIPEDHSQLVRAVFFLFTSLSFILLVIDVTGHGILTTLDLSVFHFLRSLYDATVQHWMTLISFIGEPDGLAVLWVVLLGWFAWRRDWYTGIHWFFLGMLTVGFAGVLKRLVMIPRPDMVFQAPTGWSFPSGHTTLSVAFFGFLALLITNTLRPKIRRIALAITFSFVSIIAFSRIYLGAHWFTDVLGGALLGISIILAITISYKRQLAPDLCPIKLLLVTLLSLSVTTSLFIYKDYRQEIKNFTPKFAIQKTTIKQWWQDGLSIGEQPLHSANRWGHSIQTINLQWVDKLADIQQQLIKNDWFKRSGKQLTTVINYLGAKDRNMLLPLLQPRYSDQQPVLVMGKYFGEHKKRLLIIRLWRSHTEFMKVALPLWIGTLNYRHTPRHHFLSHIRGETIKAADHYPPVAKQLIADLGNNRWKKLIYPDYKRLNEREDLDWDGSVLLVSNEEANE